MSPPPTLASNLIHTIHTHTAPINALSVSHNGGTYVLTGSSDRQIHLCRTEPASSSSTTTTPIQRYTSHGYAVLDLTISSTNNTFASSSADRSGPFLWDINEPSSTLRRFGANSPSPHTARITCVSFTAEDNLLTSGSDDRSVRLWDMKSRDGRPLMVLEDAKDGVTCLACRGVEIVTGSSDGRIRTYDVRIGRCTIDVQPGPVTSLCLGRDGRTVLVGCLDGKMRLMDRENGSCLRSFPGGEKVNGESEYKNESLRLQSCLAVNDGLVISGSEGDGRVRAWDVLSGKMVGDIDVSETGKVVNVVKWREGSDVEGRRGALVAGGADGVVKVYA